MDLIATPVTPPGSHCSPTQVRLRAQANRSMTAAFQIVAPVSHRLGKPSRAESRYAIALDVTCNGKYLGQIAEAVVDVT